MHNTALANTRVLVVDDDDACRYYLEILLEGLGCSFAVAENGREAVEKVLSGTFDLVLMDLRMPILNGYEATCTIRKTHPDLPIIALTANALAWSDGQCQACGINDCLVKPFQKEQLEIILLSWIVNRK